MVTKETEAWVIDTIGLLTQRGLREIRPRVSFLFSSTSQPSHTTRRTEKRLGISKV